MTYVYDCATLLRRVIVKGRRQAAFLVTIAIVACSTPHAAFGEEAGRSSGAVEVVSAEIGRNDHYIVIVAERGESYAGLASRHLGDPSAGWYVAKHNDNRPIESGDVVVVPRAWRNVGGVESSAYQSVPVLGYHNFGPSTQQLSVTAENFREQLGFLRDNGFNVIQLRDLMGFLNGDRGLPERAVVITIDDGYQSAYKIAFPLLREFGFPATIFPYSDFLNKGGLKTAQMKEMLASGLIDIQAHSKTHSNLAEVGADETAEDYARRVDVEVETPHYVVSQLLGNEIHSFAYPYGKVTKPVIGKVYSSKYEMGFTVSRRSNSSFAHPYLLGRTMVFNRHTLEDFAELLVVRESF